MIRKFLVVGQFVTLSSSRPEEDKNATYVVELMMPIQVHWDIEKILEKASFLVATGQQFVDVQDLYRKIFLKAAPFALFENDRTWLYQRGGQAKKN